jgi:hypothetical protein
MRLLNSNGGSGFRKGWQGARGFTLTELSIASTIFMLVVAGVITTNIFGLRMIEYTEPKQQAARRAQELINELSDDINTAWLVEVGNGTLDTFTPVQRGTPKTGNALKIVPDGEDPSYYVVYYKDPSSDEFLRDTTTAPEATVVAWGVTNNLVFTGEAYNHVQNQWMTLDHNRTSMGLHVLLHFSELERTGTPVGPEFIYKSCQFETRLTWRAR